MSEHKKMSKGEKTFLTIAFIVVVIILLWQLFGASDNSAQPAAVIPADDGTIPQATTVQVTNGPINTTFTNLPSTTGIATYIPLFGFLRFGPSFG